MSYSPTNAGASYVFDVKGTKTCLGLYKHPILDLVLTLSYYNADEDVWKVVSGPKIMQQEDYSNWGGVKVYFSEFTTSLNKALDEIETLGEIGSEDDRPAYLQELIDLIEKGLQYNPGEGTSGELVIK